jgi:hypothetical protein
VAVAVRQKSEKIETISGNTTVTEPAGAASGDALFAYAVADSASSLTKPTGWTDLYSGTQGLSKWLVSWITRGGSAPALTWGVGGTSIYREVYLICLQAAAAITLDSQSAAGASGNASNHNPDPPATTAVQSTSLAISGGHNFNGCGAGGWTVSTGYTVQTSHGASQEAVIQVKSLSASGSENPAALANVNASGTPDYWEGFTVTFTDAAGGGGGTIGGPCFDGRTFRGLTFGRVLGAPMSREARMMAEADRLWRRDQQLRRAA